MKIGIIGDIHWSKYSSILRSRGNKYSTRLENCIESINWAEETTKDCDLIVYLGDFFDYESLKSEEITALSEINWNNVQHEFLVGNHELGLNDLTFSSAHIFKMNNMEVITSPTLYIDDDEETELCFLPYILNNTGNLEDYFEKHLYFDKRVIFSHNDIAGIQLGKFIAKSGFSIENIEKNCDLFINGHIHNGSKISDKIYNVGNLTGQNFSEDAMIYKHNIFILDTHNLNIEILENPYSLKFYKFDSLEDLVNFNFNSNSIITAKLYNGVINEARTFVNNNKNILAHRFIISQKDTTESSLNKNVSLTINHLEKFQEFVLDKLGNNDVVVEELEEILK